MKNKMKFGALLFALALSASMLTGCSVDLHGPHITPSGGGGGQGGGGGGETPTGDKYFVTYDANSKYTVAGLNSEGYLKGALVSFTVTPTQPEDYEIKAVSARAGNTDITVNETVTGYSFTMPEKDVRLAITTKAVDKYELTYSGDLIAEETITFVLKFGSSPYTGDFEIVGKTDADKAKINVKDAGKVYLKEAGDITVEALVNQEAVAELSITVAASEQVTLADAFADAFPTTKFNGTAGNASAKSSKSYVIGGKVLGISPYDDQGNAEVLIDDGTEAIMVMVRSSSMNPFDIVVGDSIKITAKFTNYYGMFEAIHPSSTATSQTSFYPDQLIKVEKEYPTLHLATAETMTGAQYLEYVTLAGNNSNKDNQNQALTPIKYVKIDVTYDKDHVMNGKTASIFGGYLIDGAVDGTKKYAISTNLTPNFDQGNGHKSTLSGYMVGVNTNYCTSKMWIVDQKALAPESVTITGGESLTIYQNNPKQLEYTTLPAGSYGVASWESSDPSKVAISETGVVTYVAAGTSTITVKLDGKDEVKDTIVVTADSTVSHAETVDIGANREVVYPCEPIQVTATTTPSFITDAFVWDSSDKTVATVDSTGLVTVLGPGSTVISLTIGEKSAQFTLTVKAQTLKDLSTAQAGTLVDTYGYYVGAYADGKYGYWIADGEYGLCVNTNSRPTDVQVGSIVHVIGTIAKYYGARQVSLSSHEVVTEHAGLAEQVKLAFDGSRDFTQADQGRLAVISGRVNKVNGVPAYNSADVTYEVTVGTKTVKVFLSKNNVTEAAYNDFATKVKEGKTVTIEAYVSARGGQNDEISAVAADKYQLVNPKCTSSVAPATTGVEINEGDTVEVKQGASVTLTAKILPVGAEGTVAWSVTGNSKVSIDPATGVVTVAEDAEVNSTATVTATVGSFTDTCTIKVLDKSAKVQESVEKTVTELTTENSWTASAGSTIGTKITSFDFVKNIVKLEFTGTGNTATVWSGGSEMRIYANANTAATIKVSAYEGYQIVSFTVVYTFNTEGYGEFPLGSGVADTVNASSKTYSLTKAANAGGNPQLKITKFVIEYKEL